MGWVRPPKRCWSAKRLTFVIALRLISIIGGIISGSTGVDVDDWVVDLSHHLIGLNKQYRRCIAMIKRKGAVSHISSKAHALSCGRQTIGNMEVGVWE